MRVIEVKNGEFHARGMRKRGKDENEEEECHAEVHKRPGI